MVVKGHDAYPGTGEVVADAIRAAVETCGLHPGVFSLIQGGSVETGRALVRHPLIRAVGFTGSLRGGRALFDLCAARPEPILFYGELGSVNPMFVLPHALAARGEAVAEGFSAGGGLARVGAVSRGRLVGIAHEAGPAAQPGAAGGIGHARAPRDGSVRAGRGPTPWASPAPARRSARSFGLGTGRSAGPRPQAEGASSSR